MKTKKSKKQRGNTNIKLTCPTCHKPNMSYYHRQRCKIVEEKTRGGIITKIDNKKEADNQRTVIEPKNKKEDENAETFECGSCGADLGGTRTCFCPHCGAEF